MYISGCDVIPVKVAGSLVSKRQNAGRRGHELTLIDVMRCASLTAGDKQKNIYDSQKASVGT